MSEKSRRATRLERDRLMLEAYLYAETGECGLPGYANRGFGRWVRALGSGCGAISIDYIYVTHDRGRPGRWMWHLTGAASVDHPTAKAYADSALDAMLAADNFAAKHHLDAPLETDSQQETP